MIVINCLNLERATCHPTMNVYLWFSPNTRSLFPKNNTPLSWWKQFYASHSVEDFGVPFLSCVNPHSLGFSCFLKNDSFSSKSHLFPLLCLFTIFIVVSLDYFHIFITSYLVHHIISLREFFWSDLGKFIFFSFPLSNLCTLYYGLW